MKSDLLEGWNFELKHTHFKDIITIFNYLNKFWAHACRDKGVTNC